MKNEKTLGGSNDWLESAGFKSSHTLEQENKTVTSIRLPFSKFREVERLAESHGLDRSKVLRRLIYTGLREIKGGSE